MRYGRYILTSIFTFWAIVVAQAQRLDAEYYDYPLRGVAGYYSANFGEMRTNHFHSGVDFKTDGVEGKEVVAVADGYVNRIFLSPSGYGLALYVTHPNGTISVYAHLKQFRKDIAEYVFAERHRLKRHRVDLYCQPGQFKVRRGEVIALSGNSGSSAGPHLHFEIRNAATHKPRNIIAAGLFAPKDDISPLIRRLHYVEVDSVGGVARHSRRISFDVMRREGAIYSLKDTLPIEVGRKGYFIVEVSDRKNDTQNRYGIYHLEAEVDGEVYFEYRNDGFTFDQTRYCNAVAYYPLQRSSKSEVIRLAGVQGGINNFYPTLVDNGVITTREGSRRAMRIKVTDDCLNTSTLEFAILGKPDEASFVGAMPDSSKIAWFDRTFSAEADGVVGITIPAKSLYESVEMELKRSETPIKADSTIILLSEVYTIGDRNIPLHKAMTIDFHCSVEQTLESHAAIASVSERGTLGYVGGTLRNSHISQKHSSFGDFCVVADCTPPTITPNFKRGADCRERKNITFALKDNFSGIASYNATIDGRWVAVDFQHGRASINLTDEGITGGVEYTVIFTATDSCGNKASWKGTFLR